MIIWKLEISHTFCLKVFAANLNLDFDAASVGANRHFPGRIAHTPPPYPAHLTAVITPPARIKPRLGQKVHIAKIPKPTGFGFGSLVQPKAANRIVKSSGPVPSTNIVTPPPINISGNRNRARVLAAGLGALTPKSGGR